MFTAARRLANIKTREEAGLDYVVSAMNLLTPFGAKQIKEQKPFFPGEEGALEEELDRVAKMVDTAEANRREISILQEIFMMIKDNTFSIERSDRSVLSVVEIFEIKNLMLLMEKIRELSGRIDLPEEFVPEDITALLDVLDPGGDRLNTFYIYDSFSEKLAGLRSARKNMEREIRSSRKALRSEIRQKYGVSLTPKFDIAVSKTNSDKIKMMEEISELAKSEEDYMSVTFTLVPDDTVQDLMKRMDSVAADIEEEELIVRERLSKEIHKHAGRLLENCRRIGRLDIILAKALYAEAHNCVRPEIAGEHVVEFEDGRHLQVEEIIRKKGGEYCPVSIALKDGVTCITGANMGGKTVSLKLTGMVAMLAQYGYFVPCKKARVGLSNFMQILIGDSQSIERGLSSFGSEMEELKEMIDNSRDRSLLLIDEIASGTNPVEGLALTKSIVDYLKEKTYISLITTHFETVTADRDVINMQVTGLAHVDFETLNREIRYASRRERIHIIRKYMDYRLTRVDNAAEIPKDALNIAKMLGIRSSIIDKAREYIV